MTTKVTYLSNAGSATHVILLSRAHSHSITTPNYLQSLLMSGFASLHHPRHWSLSHVQSPSLRFVDILFKMKCTQLWIDRREFEMIVDGLLDAVAFSPTIGADAGVANGYERGGPRGDVGEADFYTRYHYFPRCPYDVINLLVATRASSSTAKQRSHVKWTYHPPSRLILPQV